MYMSPLHCGETPARHCDGKRHTNSSCGPRGDCLNSNGTLRFTNVDVSVRAMATLLLVKVDNVFVK